LIAFGRAKVGMAILRSNSRRRMSARGQNSKNST
jgi:hypothetical protein